MPAGCPGDPDIPDCDDNDPTLGGYDENYFCECMYSFDNESEGVIVSETWDTPRFKDRDVIINSGVTLTITNMVRMVESSRIIVEPGATLIVDGGWITNMCDEFWNGIELRGNAYLGQSTTSQGKAIFINNAVIENALVGIETIKKTRNSDGTWTKDYTFSGGIIESGANTQFLNCKTAVWFHPYPLHQLLPKANISYFDQTEFSVDDFFLPLNESFDFSNYDLTNKFEQMVLLDGVSDIEFIACSFSQNIDFGQDSPKEWLGRGIYANNSTFHISSYWDKKSSFSNFEYGVHTISSQWWAEGHTSIRETDFVNNFCGIYTCLPNNFVSPVEIIMNEFTVNKVLSIDYGTGIYLDNTSSFFVEENVINGDNGDLYQTTFTSNGIVVNDCGETSNRLYNNTLIDLDYGVRAQNKNRNRDGSIGLSILCNEFDKCYYDNYIMAKQPLKADYGIAKNQGVNEEDDPQPDDPAGNIFYYDDNPPEYDIANFTNDITYWYHLDDGGFHIKPEKYTMNLVFPLPNQYYLDPFNKSVCCPTADFIQNGRTAQTSRAKMYVNSSLADSLLYELSMLVDAGETENLNTEVQTSWPDETLEIRQDLLDASPYLSDTVMISAAGKEDVIPNAILTEVLVANPQSAKSYDVMTAVDSRDTLLNQTQFDLVMTGKTNAGEKEKLESQIGAALLQKEMALKNLIIAWHQDSLINTYDSSILILTNEEQVSLKYPLVDLYLGCGDTTSAKAAYNQINTHFELNNDEYVNWTNYEEWLDFRIDQLKNGKNISEADSTQLITLYQLYADAEHNLKATVRNLLRFTDTLMYNEPYLTADTTLKSTKTVLRPANDKQGIKQLKIYPNPARDYTVVDFSGIKMTGKELSVIFYSVDGKPVITKTVDANHQFEVVVTAHLKPGIYIIALNNHYQLIGSQTLIKLR